MAAATWRQRHRSGQASRRLKSRSSSTSRSSPKAKRSRNIDSLAQEDRRGRRPRRPDRRRTRKLGQPTNGEEFDFEKEVEPWLGEQGRPLPAGLRRRRLRRLRRGDADHGRRRQRRNSSTSRSKRTTNRPKNGSYEGVDFKVAGRRKHALASSAASLVIAEDEAIFKVDGRRLQGRDLAGRRGHLHQRRSPTSPATAPPTSSSTSARLIEEAGSEIDSETKLFLDSVGIEPKEATAVASLVPGSEQVEIDLSTNLSGDNPPQRRRLGAARLAAGDLGRRLRLGRIRRAASTKGSTGSTRKGSRARCHAAQAEADAEGIGDRPRSDRRLDRRRRRSSSTGNSESSLGGGDSPGSRRRHPGQEHRRQPRPLPPLDRHPGVTAVTAKAQRLLDPQPRTGPPARSSSSPRAAASRSATAWRRPCRASRKRAGPSPTRRDLQGSRSAPSARRRSPSYVDGGSALKLATALMPPDEKTSRKRSRTCRRSIIWRWGPKRRGTSLPPS